MHHVNVNVNVHVYSPDIPVGSADCTIYTPGIGTHSFTVSSPLGRIQHLSTLQQYIANSLQFSFLVPPGTHYCWVDRGGVIWEACPTPLHMSGSVTRAAVTHPSNRARRLPFGHVLPHHAWDHMKRGIVVWLQHCKNMLILPFDNIVSLNVGQLLLYKGFDTWKTKLNWPAFMYRPASKELVLTLQNKCKVSSGNKRYMFARLAQRIVTRSKGHINAHAWILYQTQYQWSGVWFLCMWLFVYKYQATFT